MAAASQERISRACAAMENINGAPLKTEKIKDLEDKLLLEAKDGSKNLGIEVYNQNATGWDQVIELWSDDDEADIGVKRCRRVIEEGPFEPYCCKRSKISMGKEKETDYIQVCDHGGKFCKRSWFNFENKQTDGSVRRTKTWALSKGEAQLTGVSFNSDRLYEENQNQALHESIPSDNGAPIAAIHQDQISCEFGSSSRKVTNVKVEGSILGECSHNCYDTSQLDIVSSDNGAIKISLTYNSSRKDILDTPNLEAIIRKRRTNIEPFTESHVEDVFRNITYPNLSVFKLMQDICKRCSSAQLSKLEILNTNEPAMTPTAVDKETQISQLVHGCRLKAVMKNLQDITRGEEGVQIPLFNDNGAMELPNFFYISKNIVFKDAYVSFSLARISDESYCSQCVGDCLSSEIPCACAGETRGEFAYTKGGFLKEKFLEEAITMSRKPKRQHFYYCENCPLENKPLEKYKRKRACKGHLMRKFIKECWDKCGCNKKCGNRVVQRGITASLQVFGTQEGKGWGLRAMNALKKGTFVCEYVGEIVTNHELHLRNNQRSGEEEQTYPVLLDADWGSERVLKDEEALCLDATNYGNCGRFINHRCVDSNLVEIPVEIEIPDHHYYHLAFFTARDIEAGEELTWDYGIHFDDKTHPIKAFNCKCGSKFCRDK